jgi:uncharacterized membrane protein YbaN (DUF454 family)
MVGRFGKYLLLICGYIFLAVGFLGIIIPILPTTPFLLLAAACFLRSSEKLYRWLINHKMFGKLILCYEQYRAISLKAKVLSVTLLWVGIVSSAWFFVSFLWLRILLVIIGAGVSGYILRLKTVTKDMLDQLNKKV